MTKSQYAQQLKSPEWKAKRLSILNRDNHKCTKCGSVKGLHVHHLSYTQGCNAWEYPDDNLVTLCGECHKVEHLDIPPEKFYRTYLSFMAPVLGITKGNDFKVLCGMMFFVEYDTDKVSLTPEKRKELEKLVSLQSQTVSNALNNLKKLKLITGSRGDYRIDPQVLWLGTLNTRAALLKNDKGLNVNIKFESND